jgi:hypothetical protein
VPLKHCSIHKCGRQVVARGWCDAHYRRWKKHGDPEYRRTPSVCAISDCVGVAIARGWCSKHYYRWKRNGDPLKVVMGPECPRICKRCCGKGPFFKSYRVCKECRRKMGYKNRGQSLEAYRKRERDWARAKHKERRAATLAAYGGRCACCGETRPVFLAIDHKEGGGNKHRRSLSSAGKIVGSSNMYAWIVRNNFPPIFRILCHNCNYAEAHGGCPHRLEKQDAVA